MNVFRSVPLLAAAAMLGACDVRVGHDDDSNAVGSVSAAGKSEEGQMSVSAPGFEMKLDIPEAVRNRAGIDDENGLIYPNAQFSGIHVQGGREGGQGRSHGEVELRFTTTDAPEAVARWYRDPARNPDFTVASAAQEGADFVVAGTTRENEGQFRLRLAPRSAGGTDARLVIADRSR